MDAEFGCILGQPLHATPCVVGLLPPQPVWSSRHGVWAEAVLIVACSCRGNIALVGLTRFQGLALTVSAFPQMRTIGLPRPLGACRSDENDPTRTVYRAGTPQLGDGT